jgi:transcriptional regulator with XRE-family HTH domain
MARGTTLSEALADLLREELVAHSWTQAELARRLRCSRGTVNYLLNGRRRQHVLDFFDRLSGVLGLSLGALFSDLETRVGRGLSESEHWLASAPPDVREQLVALIRISRQLPLALP